MTYSITNSVNGTITIQDGNVDNSTSLSLNGRGTTGFGQYNAQNLYSMLCNSAGTVSPNNPITGQLWFNSTTGFLNYNSGSNTWNAIASQSWATGQIEALATEVSNTYVTVDSVSSGSSGIAQLTQPPSGSTSATNPYNYYRLPFHDIAIGTWFNAGTWDANANNVLQETSGRTMVDPNTSLLSGGQQLIDLSYNGTYMAGTIPNPDYQTVTAEGCVYRCIAAGTTNLDGYDQWDIDDLAVCVSGKWIKVTINFNNVTFSAGTF
jgi:hypothetical protein